MEKAKKLEKIGQSLWYDNIQRSLLINGDLQKMINLGKIKGVTSNPSIFQKAISNSKDYDNTLKPMAWAGMDAESIFWRLAIEDIQKAADLFRPIYEQTQKKDGYVSLEVNPLFARDTAATIVEAQKLWDLVNRPNLMIKIPATKEGLPAIRKAISRGINVNVTLIFSIQRYAEVMDAYISGLEDRIAESNDLSSIASVASFFVSRLDTKIDGLLDKLARNGQISEEKRIDLAGKAAIANTKLAYRLFEHKFSEKRVSILRAKGAQIQRPLWASTSTKNPEYRDVLYIEELIAPETVNTVPPSTLDAFYDHGNVDLTIHNNLDGAEKIFNELEALGISLNAVTLQLEEEGVKSFADAFTQLLDAVEQRRVTAVSELGSITPAVKDQISRLDKAKFVTRLYQKDATLWSKEKVDQVEIYERMNWLTAPWDSQEFSRDLHTLAQECKLLGYNHAVLLGMGGSSLAPEVLSLINGSGRDQTGLTLTILDSTDPEQVSLVEKAAPLENTIFLVASKSGTTAEINAFLAYFWDRAQKRFGEKAGEHFIAITDPETRLEKLAQSRGFWKIYTADPKVGGRNSALTAFGLVPAALIGMDVDKLLENAVRTAELCLEEKPISSNPGVVLGAILGAAANSGKDKLTLITDREWIPFGAWLEQLIAESSGKNGKGIVPIADEPLMDAAGYGNDRLFVYIRQSGDQQLFVDSLRQYGFSVISFNVSETYDLGGQFYLWQVATATACSIIGVNSFDQPDVQDAKTRTVKGLAEYKQNGKFTETNPVAVQKEARIMAGSNIVIDKDSSIFEVIEMFIEKNQQPNDYLAINAFLPRTEANNQVLQELRERILKKFSMATTLGFGPRYLHSTGQLHKGGANNGLFIVITTSKPQDMEIPGEGVTFGTMQRAQALGDLQALEAKARRVLWIDLNIPDPCPLL